MLNTLKKYRATLFDDMLAGLTGAVAGAPQAMGFAILAGVSPLYGLYAAFITSVVSSLLSSSQLLVFAPTNALALVAGSAIMVAPPDKQLDVLFLLSILTGIFLLLIGPPP
ncbi:MAG: SulP family inorganic anion transporter [Chloroflexota bacterium]